MKVRLGDAAEADIIEGKAFYSRQGESVAEYFQSSILSDIQSLAVYGGIHSKQYGFYCMSAKRFPCAVYYDVDESVVSVVAILDARRDPDRISQRLRGKES